jgi:hypothetical protein
MIAIVHSALAISFAVNIVLDGFGFWLELQLIERVC